MTAAVSEVTPSIVVAGLNADWKRYYKDYLYADSWVVTYYLVGDGAQITIAGTDNGDSFHRFTKLASETSSYKAGEYSYTAVAINGTSKVAVETGLIKIQENFITATGGLDTRSDNKKILDNLNKVVLELSKAVTTEVTVDGVSYKRSSLNELIKTQNHYKTLVAMEIRAERVAQGLADTNKKYVRFVPK